MAVLIGGFLGLSLQHSWQISVPAMLLAGGLIFLLVSLRTVLEQYTPSPIPHPVPEGTVPAHASAPSAFELAVPMIVTGRCRTGHGCGCEQCAGLGTLVFAQIDLSLTLPCLTRHDALRPADRPAHD